jgi:hypothetical protein
MTAGYPEKVVCMGRGSSLQADILWSSTASWTHFTIQLQAVTIAQVAGVTASIND